MKPPTKRQLECLRAIDAYIREHDCSPSFSDMRDALGLKSTNACFQLVASLGELRLITSKYRKARTIKLTQSGIDLLYAPDGHVFRAEARIEELGL